MSRPPKRPDRLKVLLIAFHFPPFKGSSGLERTLAFCRSLPARGWQPMVLGAHPRAFARTSDERVGDIPAGVRVERPFALDTVRHLSIRGRHLPWMALPDRWASWLIGAIPRGLRMIRQERPRAIWSTYPIASAHWIGWALHRLTKLPWIADFRDPMVEYNQREQYYAPRDPRLRRARLRIERLCARHAARVVFCTEGARRIFLERYPDFPADRALIIPNGFDEASFAGLDAAPPAGPDAKHTLTLLHSGVLYPGPDRDPSAFLQAVRRLVDEAPEWKSRLRIRLRASGYLTTYAAMIADLGLQEIVELAPSVPYRAALAEMMAVDGLLVFQGYTSNPAIPAKLYEYLRARRPILALTDGDGDTAALLRKLNVGTVLPIEESSAIESGLKAFLGELDAGTARVLAPEKCADFDRTRGADALAQILDAVALQSENNFGSMR